MRRHLVFALIFAVVTPAGTAMARDWPQWRGPFLNGSTDETNLPDSWSKTENILWRCTLPGPSGATPIISRGRVFVSSTDTNTGDLWALCFDAETGRELWRKKMALADRRFPRNNMASPSPVADGEKVFFFYGNGDLFALDYQGNKLWQRRLEKEYGSLALLFGFSTTPLLYKGRMYINILRRPTHYRAPEADGPLDSFLLCVDPKDGSTVFKQVRDVDDVEDETYETYTTAMVHEVNGRAEILVMGADCITGHDPATGKELWRYHYGQPVQNRWRTIPSLVTGDGLVFAVRPKYNGAFALNAAGKGKSGEDYIVWRFDGPVPDCSTPLYYDGLLYLLDGMRHGKVVTCLEPKTGEQKWQGTIGGRGPWRASLTGADGKLYCICETGEIVVLAAGPEKFEILFSSRMDEGPIQSSIAVADGRLFIRTAENLYCVGKTRPPGTAE